MERTIREGACLCGAVRFRVTGAPLWVTHCHCTSCRRASGAPMSTWVGVQDAQFALLGGEPARVESSPGVTRSFCASCGTPLTYQAERYPGEVHVMIGAFDDPGAFTPTHHVWTSERVPWLHIEDGLPRRARVSRKTTES